MREQAQHVILVRWQIDCLVDGEGEVVGEVAPIAKIAHPRGAANKKKRGGGGTCVNTAKEY